MCHSRILFPIIIAVVSCGKKTKNESQTLPAAVQEFCDHVDSPWKTSLLAEYDKGDCATTITFLRKQPEINLSDRGIPTIEFLKNAEDVRSLILRKNQIESIDVVASLSNLSYLDIAHNRIKSLKALSLMNSIKILDIASNQISSLQDLKDLQLESLSASLNNIKSTAGLPETLRNLYLAENEISEFPNLHSLQELEILDISNNQLKLLPILKSSLNLKTFYAGSNGSYTAFAFGMTPDLIDLNLDGWDMDQESKGSIQTLANLRSLSLSGSHLYDLDGFTFPDSLRELNLSCNYLRDDDHLNDLKSLNLESLNLLWNELTDDSMNRMVSLGLVKEPQPQVSPENLRAKHCRPQQPSAT